MKIKKANIDYPYILLAFLLIYFGSNTLFTQITLSSQLSSYFVFFLSFFLYFIRFKKHKNLNKQAVSVVVLLAVLIHITILVNWDMENYNGYIIIIMKIVGAFLLLRSIDFERFKKAFSSVMMVFVSASLIVTYIFPLFSLEYYLPVVRNSMGVPFFNAFLSYKINSYGDFGIRNYGIFSEPAVYCFYLFITAVFMFTETKLTKGFSLKMSLVIFTMITTFSPIGLATAAICWIMLLYKLISKKSSVSARWIPAICVLLGVLLFLYNTDMRSGFDSLLGKVTLTIGNGMGRLNSIVYNIRSWLLNPLFGGGLLAITAITNDLGFNTSTTGTLLSCFGIFFASVATVMQYKSTRLILKKEKAVIAWIFFIMFLLQINNHGFIQGDWFWFYTMIGVAANKHETSDTNLQPGKY